MGKRRTEDQLWLLPEEGTARSGLIADVAVCVRTRRLYSYAVPAELAARVGPGVTLRAPYGRNQRLVQGWCVHVAEGPWDRTLKPIAEVTSDRALLPVPLIGLAVWISEYYACPPGQTFDALVPSVIRSQAPRRIKYVVRTGEDDGKRLTARQSALLDAVGAGARGWDAIRAQTGVSSATLKTLVERGLVSVELREEDFSAEAGRDGASLDCEEDRFALTDGQRCALAAISDACAADDSAFSVFLLFGVPGSGKTEVYVRAMRAVIALKRQAIVIVPEIALATQFVERLARRFARVAVLHSRLTRRQRYTTHRRIEAGAVDVVIGTRTAVFAPCPRLGMLVVDEEQETSLKNLTAPFYNARDVAIQRARLEGVPVVLGSATPALETWHNASTLPHYRLLRLPQRVPGARLPKVELIETRGRALGETPGALAPPLAGRLRDALARNEQALLLHNRRGFAAYLRCTDCGLPVACERCGTSLVYHSAGRVMKCHRCGKRSEPPKRCLDDTCAGPLERGALAIQALEQELERLFPQARLLRLDSDRMRKREDYVAALLQFQRHEADIMLGTQMVAKGLDFPAVRLVGVLEADAALNLPDFRAHERGFQLIVQVVGRAGRKEGDSLALVQTRDANAAVLHQAVRLDYEAFAASELALRRELFDPPFSRLVRLICLDRRPAKARQAAEALAAGLRTLAGRVHADIRVDDAEACIVPRLREMSRYHVLVRVPRETSAHHLLAAAEAAKLLSPRVQRFTIDVDPVEMM